MTDPFGFESVSLQWLQHKPGVKWSRYPGTLAAWIADMDFPPAPAVLNALRNTTASGDFGYPNWRSGGSPAQRAFIARCARRYGWQVELPQLMELNDVVQGIQIVLHTSTQPGDRVVVHTPAYPPMLHSVEDSGRELVRVPAQPSATSPSGWVFDHAALDAELTARPAKALLLCHPHNPTGHVFSPAELRELAALAERHDLLIISDEIHADLTYAPLAHQPIALFAPERSVTIHAASKAFNLAGLRYAIAHFGSVAAQLRVKELPHHLFGAPNVYGVMASASAWNEGDEWLAAVMAHLDRNRHLLVSLLRGALPTVGYHVPAGTYLAWLDCRALSFGDDPSRTFAARGVRLSEGPSFGHEGRGFARLNFATSSAMLRSSVERMAA
ncbi:MAG: aminotransferase class I/II-fold pyridoxal phosphate-dependent enzyme [Actinomycetota bacterium]